MTRLAVVYDEGAVTAGEIAVGLAPLGGITFVVGGSVHVVEQMPLLRELGTVVPLADAARRRYDAVLTFSERMLHPTAVLADALGLRFHDPATVRALTSKSTQRTCLADAGVDTVRHHRIDGPDSWRTALAHVGLPAVLKPDRGEGSGDTVLVSDAADAAQAVGEWFGRHDRPLTLEEYLRGRESRPYGDYVSVESAVSDGAVSTIAVTGKSALVPPFREAAQFWPCHLPDHERDAVADLAGRAVRALGVRTGLTHTEVKLTTTGPRLIEVNGRLGGFINELSLHATGQDLVTLAGRLALGEDASLDPPTLAGVHFQHTAVAPRSPCVLVRVEGAREVRSLPGVTGYRPVVRPGTRLPGGVATTVLDVITGTAGDHDTMFRVLEAALEAVRFTFANDDGRTWQLSGRDLARDADHERP